MARQARCWRCKVRYVWARDYKLDGGRLLCPVCSDVLRRTTSPLPGRLDVTSDREPLIMPTKPKEG